MCSWNVGLGCEGNPIYRQRQQGCDRGWFSLQCRERHCLCQCGSFLNQTYQVKTWSSYMYYISALIMLFTISCSRLRILEFLSLPLPVWTIMHSCGNCCQYTDGIWLSTARSYGHLAENNDRKPKTSKPNSRRISK